MSKPRVLILSATGKVGGETLRLLSSQDDVGASGALTAEVAHWCWHQMK